MAFGGGTYITENKTMPGAYINFVTASSGASVFGERGVVAFGMKMDWSNGQVIELTAEDFYRNSRRLLGYDSTDSRLTIVREIFKNANKVYLGPINASDRAYAACQYCKAAKAGMRGNHIKIAVYTDADDTDYKKVYVYLGDTLVDTQKGKTTSDLSSNDYVTWIRGVTLENTAGVTLTGGANGNVTGESVQGFLNRTEEYTFNVLSVLSDDSSVQKLVAEYTKRMRETRGKKFQAVVYEYYYDYEGVVNTLGYIEDEDHYYIMGWIAGALAGCEVNESLTNKEYNGEYEIYNPYTQSELETRLAAGEFLFHMVGGKMKVLKDINSLVTFTEEKGSMFQNNQVVRVCDQISTDTTTLFEQYYLGRVANDKAGRNSLWSDLVKYHQKLVNMRALEEFDEDAITVAQGESKTGVVVYEKISPVNSMEILYMKITLE